MINRSTIILCSLLVFLVGCGGAPATESPTATEEKPGQIYVDVYDPEKACDGTTLFADLHDPQIPRIVEVNMQGEIVWEYVIPENLRRYQEPGLDVKLLSNGNILFVLPLNGVYEIDRSGSIVWHHLDDKISHDADRLPNGNTLFVWGGADAVDDAQVKEVNPAGEIVWSWHAKHRLHMEPYIGIERQGWTHTNAVTRLGDGNTLISLRNFNVTLEVMPGGAIVWAFDWSNFDGYDPHEPEILPDDHLLVCLQGDTPHQVVEMDRVSAQVVWEYYRPGLRTTRDCDRLPNGNTLIVGVIEGEQDSVIFEVTPDGEIVWQLKLKDVPAMGSPGWFYKAQRICQSD
jgi:hypothetical protein